MDGENRQIAFDHAWKWFELHASQRMQLFRFYIILVGICLAGYATARKEGIFPFQVLLPVFGTLVTFCFISLDSRTRRLIKIAEVALDSIETDFSYLKENEKFNFIKKADDAAKTQLTYTSSFKIMHYGAISIFIVIFIYEIFTNFVCVD